MVTSVTKSLADADGDGQGIGTDAELNRLAANGAAGFDFAVPNGAAGVGDVGFTGDADVAAFVEARRRSRWSRW
jgi:hypothetical protein